MSKLSDKTTEPPWCCLCGQRHPMGTACDPVRIDWLREQAAAGVKMVVVDPRKENQNGQ